MVPRSLAVDNSLNGTLASTLTESTFEQAEALNSRRDVRCGAHRVRTTGLGHSYFRRRPVPGTPYAGNGRRFETHTEFADTVALQFHQHFVQFGGRASTDVALEDACAGWFG